MVSMPSMHRSEREPHQDGSNCAMRDCSDFSISAHPQDASGYQARADLTKCSGVCALQKLMDSDGQADIHMQELTALIRGIPSFQQPPPNVSPRNGIRGMFTPCGQPKKSPAEHQDDDLKMLAERELQKIQLRLGGAMPSIHTGSANASTGQFLAYVKAYAVLHQDSWVRHVAAYMRAADLNDIFATPFKDKCWYLIFPCVLFFFAFAFQSFMLHIATHFYIKYMEQGPKSRRQGGGQLYDLIGNWVASKFAHHVDQKGAVLEGSVEIPLWLLDASGIVPMIMFVLVYGSAIKQKKFCVGLWNQTFIVASTMAVLKGVFDVVTILPDSIGWETCKDRLKEEGVQQLGDWHFSQNFWGTLPVALWHEVFGGEDGRRTRYCADMMISGHTYFAAVFALSTYKQVSLLSRRSSVLRLLRWCVCLLCVACLSAELILVALSRFHYTVDMIASIVLVLILFDSKSIEQLAVDWSEGFDFSDPRTFEPKSTILYKFLYRLMRKATAKKCEAEGFDHILPSESFALSNHRAQHAGYPPWWRRDPEEESACIAKIHGYDRLPQAYLEMP